MGNLVRAAALGVAPEDELVRKAVLLLLLACLHVSMTNVAGGQEVEHAYDLVGIAFGHDSKAGALGVGALSGRLELLAGDRSSVTVDIKRVEARGIGSKPQLARENRSFEIASGYQRRANVLQFADRSIRSALASADGELLALLGTTGADGMEAVLALGRRQDDADETSLSGQYVLRGFAIALPDAARCVSENQRGTLTFEADGPWQAKTSVHRAEWDFDKPLFRDAGTLSQEVRGTSRLAPGGRVELRGGGADWNGFAAKGGKLLVLTESDESGYGLMLAVKTPERGNPPRYSGTHHILGASIEFEGRPHLAPVLLRGEITYTPTRHAFDAVMEKLKWPGFPRPQGLARESLTIRPKGEHRIADNGTFGPAGDGSDWHLMAPELGLSIYMMDFDIFAAARAESVRGMIVGFEGPSQKPR